MASNILIVDDSATMRRMIRRTVGMSGLDLGDIFEAENGIHALAVLAEEDIAVVILDVNMPVMNGVRFIQRIRDDERLAHLAVVIASTEGSQTRINELLAAGAMGFVRKPFQPEDLREILEPIIGAATMTSDAGAADENLDF